MTPPRVLFVADRWDGLGARLTPLVNAMATAEALGAGFGFVWPQRADTLAYPATALFSADFCARYELTPEDLERLRILDPKEVFAHSREEAKRLLSGLNQDTALVESNPYGIRGFVDETPGEAARRFRGAFARLAWSDDAAAIRRLIASEVGPIGTALHARFGDLVDGAWSQFLSRGKFRSSALIEEAAARTLDPGGVVAVSDSTEFASRLSTRVPAVRSIGDASPGYRSLSGPHRDWADLFALTAAERILAPSASAFSTFASQAGGGQLVDVLAVIPETERVPVMLATQGLTRDSGSFAARLEARDLCYLLDSDTGELSLSERVDLAVAARTLDPDYGSAYAREAAARLAEADIARALQAARTARRLAAANTVHQDPLLEAASVLIAATVVAAICGDASTDRERAVHAAQAIAKETAELTPHHMHRVDIARATRHLVLAFELAIDGAAALHPDRKVRHSLGMLAPGGTTGLPRMPVWNDRACDATLGLLERTSVWLTTAMGAAAKGPRPNLVAATPKSIRPLRPSSNGAHWVGLELRQAIACRAVLLSHRTLPLAALGVPAWAAKSARANLFWLPLPGDGEASSVDGLLDQWRVRALV